MKREEQIRVIQKEEKKKEFGMKNNIFSDNIDEQLEQELADEFIETSKEYADEFIETNKIYKEEFEEEQKKGLNKPL